MITQASVSASAAGPNCLETIGLGHDYVTGDDRLTVLDDVDLVLRPGETAALLGPSGSGKTTLLSILGGLLVPTRGRVTAGDTTIDARRGVDLAAYRRDAVGFVFQHANLLPFLDVEANLSVIARHAGLARRDVRTRITELLDELDLAELRRRAVNQLSGGQRQRVAVARALLHRPGLILADEPTAALDWETAQRVMDLLIDVSRRNRAALLVVTHDTRLADRFDRLLVIRNRKVLER